LILFLDGSASGSRQSKLSLPRPVVSTVVYRINHSSFEIFGAPSIWPPRRRCPLEASRIRPKAFAFAHSRLPGAPKSCSHAGIPPLRSIWWRLPFIKFEENPTRTLTASERNESPNKQGKRRTRRRRVLATFKMTTPGKARPFELNAWSSASFFDRITIR
jgi:hypothetical protein